MKETFSKKDIEKCVTKKLWMKILLFPLHTFTSFDSGIAFHYKRFLNTIYFVGYDTYEPIKPPKRYDEIRLKRPAIHRAKINPRATQKNAAG